MSGGGAERDSWSRLSMESDMELDLTTHEIMSHESMT